MLESLVHTGFWGIRRLNKRQFDNNWNPESHVRHKEEEHPFQEVIQRNS